LRFKGEVEVDEAYVPVGQKGEKQEKPRRRGGGRRRGRATGRKRLFFTLVERRSRRALFVAKDDASSKTVKDLLSKRVERGSTVYTDEFRSYERVSRFGYKHFRVKHSEHVYAVGSVHVNNAESRNWHLRAFLFFKRGISALFTNFYALATSAFVRLYAENPLTSCHWIVEVMAHAY